MEYTCGQLDRVDVHFPIPFLCKTVPVLGSAVLGTAVLGVVDEETTSCHVCSWRAVTHRRVSSSCTSRVLDALPLDVLA